MIADIHPVELPRPSHPEVSIIVLAWRQVALLDACLRSLARHETDVPFEVVIVLNGASSEVRALVRDRVHGATIVPSPVNLGFAGGNDLAARHARADLLVFLNDDAEVLPGWLDRLVAAIDDDRVGAVGSCVLFPDGRVQDAGGVIWWNGSTAVADRGRSAVEAARRGRRRVHYASACSLLVRRAAFDEVGGFDTGYHPAYYEDADLCLGLAAAGWDVLVEPTSMILHHESASSTSRFKAFLFARNEQRLRERWAHVLDRHPGPPTLDAGRVEDVLGSLPARGRRVLVVDDRAPHPAGGSGFPRLWRTLAELAERPGTEVALLPRTMRSAGDEALVAELGVNVLDDQLDDALRRWRPELVLVSRPHNAEAVIEAVRRVLDGVDVVYDAEALFFRRVELEALLEDDPDRRGELEREAARLEELERWIVSHVDHVIALSVDEAAWMSGVPGAAPVTFVPPYLAGVELTPARWEERRGALFVAGWMAGAASPNGDGLRWLHGHVLPTLERICPGLRIEITGASPPTELVTLESGSLRFVGAVDDLSARYATARVAVAPVRYGAGVKLKVMEALQAGVPVVTTTVGAEGFEPALARAICVADDPAAFAGMVADLALDRDLWFEQRFRIEAALAAAPPSAAPTVAEVVHAVLTGAEVRV